jgi:transposase
MVAIAEALRMSPEQRSELDSMARSQTLPHRQVRQARALLFAGDGVANEEIARRCEASTKTVRRWRTRFVVDGVDGVGRIRPGRGRPPAIPDETVNQIVGDTLHTRPDDGSTHWTTRTMGERFGVGKDTVARVWRARNIKPWLVERFKLSTDPRFEEKLVDVVGLYHNPPEHAVVLCADEKSQIQALERSQPSLPMKPGRAGTMTHDYKRHGTTTLFAAMDIATGEVLTDYKPRHRNQEWLEFLKLIDRTVPNDLEIHLVADNYGAHKHENVTKWLEHPSRRDRWHIHYTPTSSSWLNLIERWFKELTDKRIRRDSFTSVKQLIDAIELWTEHWNDNPQPFIWHKTAEEIIAKVRRGRAALDRITDSATDH